MSGERIWMELHRILVGRMAAPVVRCMLHDCGLGPLLAVRADAQRIDEFERIALANAPKGHDGPLGIEPSTALRWGEENFFRILKKINQKMKEIDFMEGKEYIKFFKDLFIGSEFQGFDSIHFGFSNPGNSNLTPFYIFTQEKFMGEVHSLQPSGGGGGWREVSGGPDRGHQRKF